MSAKASALRELTDQELRERLEELRQELFNLRFQKATGRLDNYMRIRQVRREIARVLTLLRERELGIQVEPAEAPGKQRRSRRLLRRWAPTKPESEGAEDAEESVEDSEEDSAEAGERSESDAVAESTGAESTGEDTNLADEADSGSESEEQDDPVASAADDDTNDSSEAESEAKRGSQG
jgi:large subunit ribosomal protein L29